VWYHPKGTGYSLEERECSGEVMSQRKTLASNIVLGGKFIEKRKQCLVHFTIIMRAELFSRFDKTECPCTPEIVLRMLNQQFNDLRRQLHMALKTINPFAVLHDLPGTTLAVSENLCLRRQPWHVVMPVTDVQLAAKVLKQRVHLAG